ncbi:MAG TPA: PHP domain-containing protein [Chloroflexia bacterium]|nr:PHP domain-containing protein [Chloroflexia bacterium]
MGSARKAPREALPVDGLALAADAAIDLQIHTTHSDGSWTPDLLIDYLVGEHFDLAAITDHDRPDSVAAVIKLGAEKGLPLLAAVEMSASWRGAATDVLCFGFAPDQPGWRDLLALAQSVVRRQDTITQEVYAKLLQTGYAFPHEQAVLNEKVGRPLGFNELGLLLLHHGYSTGPGSIGKIMTDAGFYFAQNDIAAVVDAAHRSGAVCLIAHPGRGGEFTRYDAGLLDELLREVSIDGVEAYYPAHTPEQTAMYLSYARKRDLLVSSGSDSHGPEKKPIKYRAEWSRQLLEQLGIQVAP